MVPTSGSLLRDSLFPRLGTGVGLRPPHYDAILSGRPTSGWFEVITENYLGLGGRFGGRPLHTLEQIRERFPVVFHGVSLSIGSVDPLDETYLSRVKSLAERFSPAWVSDHLCWTGVGGDNLHDLLPLPYTEEALEHVVERVKRVQDFLGRRLVLENVSTYVTYRHSTIPEWDFLAEIARRADCGILLDVNNVYVSARNHGFDPLTYFDALPAERIAQYHLAGHSDADGFLSDTHDHEVCDDVWRLYREALRRFGNVSTLLEWDDNLPDFARVEEEAQHAVRVQEEVLG